MKSKNWFALLFLGIFVFVIVGCDGQKAVIKDSQKTGLSTEERKSKKGE